MTVTSSTLATTDLETPDMKPTLQADDNFLRRILFALIVCAVATGCIAAYAGVSADQTGIVNITMPKGFAR